MISPTYKVLATANRVRNTSPGLADGCIDPVRIGENPYPNCEVRIAGRIATARARAMKIALRTWLALLLLLM
jgi:hypothetical protein